MSVSNSEILKKLEEVKSIMTINMTKYEELFNQMHAKFDIVLNTETQQNKQTKSDLKTKKTIPTKSTYIKNEIKNNKDVFLNVLYTQEEFDKCYEDKDVQKQKTEIDKIKKTADVLYKYVINHDADYKKKSTELYNEYKTSIEDEV